MTSEQWTPAGPSRTIYPAGVSDEEVVNSRGTPPKPQGLHRVCPVVEAAVEVERLWSNWNHLVVPRQRESMPALRTPKRQRYRDWIKVTLPFSSRFSFEVLAALELRRDGRVLSALFQQKFFDEH